MRLRIFCRLVQTIVTGCFSFFLRAIKNKMKVYLNKFAYSK